MNHVKLNHSSFYFHLILKFFGSTAALDECPAPQRTTYRTSFVLLVQSLYIQLTITGGES